MAKLRTSNRDIFALRIYFIIIFVVVVVVVVVVFDQEENDARNQADSGSTGIDPKETRSREQQLERESVSAFCISKSERISAYGQQKDLVEL